MKLAKRIEKLPPYLFVEISKKIAAKRAKGEDVVTFAIGDPQADPETEVLQLPQAQEWLKSLAQPVLAPVP